MWCLSWNHDSRSLLFFKGLALKLAVFRVLKKNRLLKKTAKTGVLTLFDVGAGIFRDVQQRVDSRCFYGSQRFHGAARFALGVIGHRWFFCEKAPVLSFLHARSG